MTARLGSLLLWLPTPTPSLPLTTAPPARPPPPPLPRRDDLQPPTPELGQSHNGLKLSRWPAGGAARPGRYPISSCGRRRPGRNKLVGPTKRVKPSRAAAARPCSRSLTQPFRASPNPHFPFLAPPTEASESASRTESHLARPMH